MHPTELVTLLRDPSQVGQALIQLRALLPLCNVSSLASLAPHLLHPTTLAALPDVRFCISPAIFSASLKFVALSIPVQNNLDALSTYEAILCRCECVFLRS